MRRLLAILALFGLGCGPVTMNAPRPTPNVLATRRLAGTFALDVRQVPTETVCSQAAGLVDLCVARLRDAIGSGLSDALSAQFAGGPAQAGTDYVAAFRMVELSHHRAGRDVDAFGATTAATVAVEMRWQFGLWDRN